VAFGASDRERPDPAGIALPAQHDDRRHRQRHVVGRRVLHQRAAAAIRHVRHAEAADFPQLPHRRMRKAALAGGGAGERPSWSFMCGRIAEARASVLSPGGKDTRKQILRLGLMSP
jgi:hypothetical protein